MEGSVIIGIDPGPTKSAYVVWNGEKIAEFGIVENGRLLLDILSRFPGFHGPPIMVIEKIQSLGMPVGASVFETVFWTGRFCQAWEHSWRRIPRMDVKMHLCHDSRAKDSNIRQALIDRFEPDLQPRCRPVGVLKGVSKDCWSALALAVYYHDTQEGKG